MLKSAVRHTGRVDKSGNQVMRPSRLLLTKCKRFVVCGSCDKYYRQITKTKNADDRKVARDALDEHNAIQERQRNYYYRIRMEANQDHEVGLIIMLDGMDQSSTISPHFKKVNNMYI